MNPALAAIAAVTIAGAVLAVSARDVRATLLGLLVVLLGAPLIADPWPDPVSILARIAATLLAVRLISIGLRGDLTTSGTRIGWPAEALLAAAAAVVGFGSHGLGAAGLGPPEAQAAGFAFVVLAAAPLITGRDALRLAVGALLLLVAASSIRAGLDAPPNQAEQLVGALLTIALGGAIAVIVSAARTAGGLGAIESGGLGGAGRRLPDAHRPTERETRGAARRGRGPANADLTTGSRDAAGLAGRAAGSAAPPIPGVAAPEVAADDAPLVGPPEAPAEDTPVVDAPEAPAGDAPAAAEAGTGSRPRARGARTSGTQAPDTQAPDTQAEGTKAPGARTSGTQAPGTKAPGTKPPGARPKGARKPGAPGPTTDPDRRGPPEDAP